MKNGVYAVLVVLCQVSGVRCGAGADVLLPLQAWCAPDVAANRNVLIVPLSLTGAGSVPVYDRKMRRSDGSGNLWVSNMMVGTYAGEIQGPPDRTSFIFYVDPTNAVQNAGLNTIVPTNQVPAPERWAWSMAASDARYARAGVGAAVTNFDSRDLEFDGALAVNGVGVSIAGFVTGNDAYWEFGSVVGDWSVGTLNGGTPLLSGHPGDGSGLTGVVGTNMAPYTVGMSNLDNATWLAELSANFGAYSNMNRFSTSNTFYRLQNHLPLTVLFEGDGLYDEPAGGSLIQCVWWNLTNLYGLRGVIQPAAVNYTAAQFYSGNPATSGNIGGNAGGSDTVWFSTYYWMRDSGSSLTYTTTLPADVFEVDWVSSPWGCNMTLSTNGVTAATLAGYSAVTNGNVYRWTNSSVTLGSTIKVANAAAGTNNIVAVGWWNNTNTGVIGILQTHQSSGIQALNYIPKAVRAPIYKSWAPDLIIHDFFVYNLYPYMLPWLVDNTTFYLTNTGHSDLVTIQQYSSQNSVYMPVSIGQDMARTNGTAFFDGQDATAPYQMMVQRGLVASDGGHMTTAGYQWFSSWLWNWLGLNENHLQGQVAAVGSAPSAAVAMSTSPFFWTNTAPWQRTGVYLSGGTVTGLGINSNWISSGYNGGSLRLTMYPGEVLCATNSANPKLVWRSEP